MACTFRTCVALLMATASMALGAISDEEFFRLQKQLQPTGAKWRTIPWKISLIDAQVAAASENKPIFVWAMDGHPLGCT